MPQPSLGRGTIAALLFGGVTLLGLSAFLFYRWFAPSPSPPAITNGEAKTAKKEPSAGTGNTIAAKKESVPSVVVEDEESSDEESESDNEDNEEEDDAHLLKNASPSPADLAKAEAELKAAELKAQYDTLVRMSTKLIQGNAHERAIDHLTQAIALAQSVPSAGKDIITLYNNRSAMYEKTAQYEPALRDITAVLTIDAHHLKAKLRRARIYEAQERLSEALQDYVYAMILERVRGEQQPMNERKMVSVSKLVAAQKAKKILKNMRSSRDRALPAKSYVRNILESVPAYYQWRARFSSAAGNDTESERERLQAALRETETEGEDAKDENKRLSLALDLIHLELVCERYERAFALLRETVEKTPSLTQSETVAAESTHTQEQEQAVEKSVEEEAPVQEVAQPPELAQEKKKDERAHSALLSSLRDLQGLELHLKSQLDAAMALYREALALDAQNLSAALKLCMVLLDLGENENVEREFDALLAQYPVNISVSPKSECSLNVEDEELYAHLQGRERETVNTSVIVSAPIHNSAPTQTHALTQAEKDELATARAWVFTHRTTLITARDAAGNYPQGCVEKALKELEEVIALTQNINTPEAIGARFIALLKSVHVRTQTKAAMELQPTPEDLARNRENIDEAKKLFPAHDVILQIEADQLSIEGQPEEALKLIADRGNDDLTALMIRASVITSKAFAELSNPAAMMMVQAQLGEVSAIYTHAMEIEPKAIEVMAQAAQLKSMILGDIAGAVELLKRAIELARSRDEVLEICQLLVMNEAQLTAIEQIQNGK